MYKVTLSCARFMALMGGSVLTILILLVCISVFGRTLNTLFHSPFANIIPTFSQWVLALGIGPINGDFELVEAGIAFTIFAFLPLCQITSGHASVNVLTSHLSTKVNRILSAVIEWVFAISLIIITVQLFNGMLSKRQYGETTFLLQFPVWWSYAASFFASSVASVTAVYMAFIKALEAIKMQDLIAKHPDF